MASILVVGDIILDHYVHTRVTRISPEAPVPVCEFVREEWLPGGAANVAANIQSLGGSPILVGVGDHVSPLNQLVIIETGRPTTKKTRIVAENGQHLLRVDREVRTPITEETESYLMNRIKAVIDKCSAVVISDYDKGCITPFLAKAVIEEAGLLQIPVIVDPKKQDWSCFDDATVLTPNSVEYSRCHQSPFKKYEVLLTLGADGMQLVGDYIIPALTPPDKVVDVTGAGDTVAAAMAVALSDGDVTLLQAAHFANRAAAVVVRKRGTATVTQQEMELMK